MVQSFRQRATMPFRRAHSVAHFIAVILWCFYCRQCIAMHKIQRENEQSRSISIGEMNLPSLKGDRKNRDLQGRIANGSTIYKSDWYYSQRLHTTRKGHLKNRVDPNMDKKVYPKTTEETECMEKYGEGRLGNIACHGMMSMGKGGMNEGKGMMNSPKSGKGMSSKVDSKKCSMGKGKGNIFCPDSTAPSIVPTQSFVPSYQGKGMMMMGMGKSKSSKCGKGKGGKNCTPIAMESSYPSDVPSLLPAPSGSLPDTSVPTRDSVSFPPGTSDGPSIVPTIMAPLATPNTAPTPSAGTPTISPTPSAGTPTISPTPSAGTATISPTPSSGTLTDAPTPPLSLPPGSSDGPSITPSTAPTKNGTPTLVPSLKTGPSLPSLSPIASPAAGPTPIEAPAPVSTPSNRTLELRATPFSIAYEISESNTPISDDQWMEAQNITISFLQEYLNEQFGSSSTTTVDQYFSEVLEANVTQDPPSLAYGFQILFADSTTYFPSEDEIDIVIESAFVDPFAEVLLSLLEQLDVSNPFSTTMTVTYTIRTDLKLLKRGRGQDNSDIGTSPPVKLDDEWNYDTMIQLYQDSAIKIPPFSLTYGWNNTRSVTTDDDTDPTIGETKAAANITLAYLDWYLRLMMNSKQPDSYVYMTGFGMSKPETGNVIGFHVGLQVHNSTNRTAMEKDVQLVVSMAFQPKFAVSLLQQLQISLPETNPFSKTSSLAFAFTPDETSSGLSTLTITTIIVASCAFVLFCLLLIYYRQRRRLFLIRKRENIPRVIIKYDNESIHGDLIEVISEEGTEEEDVLRLQDGLRQPLMDPPDSNNNLLYTNEEETIDFQSYTASVGSERESLWNSDTRPLKYTEPKIFEHVD